ncbi:MAG: DUF6125 family protein, partial [Desulfovibrionales bacterium]
MEKKREAVERIADAVRRIAVHYGLWFSESVHQFGVEQALEMEQEAGNAAFGLALKRVCKAAGIPLEQGLPKQMLRMEESELENILNSLAISWLAADGVWFQAVEKAAGMDDAKRVNDTCWSRFSPLEARRIMSLLGIKENGGLSALADALSCRMYSRINTQEIEWESDRVMVLRMRECRVQAARKRKGLPDYPCKSGGVVEY